MTYSSLLRAGRLAACLAYILMSSLCALPALAAPEIVAPPAATAVPIQSGQPLQETAPAAVTVNLETLNPAQPLTAPIYWRLDKTGRVKPEEVLSPAQQSFFVPFPTVDVPKSAGTSWFRLSLAPYSGKNGSYYLDLNSRVAGQIPKGQRVWLLREGQPHIQLHTETQGLYLLPDSPVPSTIFVRTEGLPAVGFAPTLRNAATLTPVDTDGAFWIGIVLAVALVFGLLRGVFEQREWRMWAALYAGTLLVSNAWGFPATPDGKVVLLDLPGLLAPGIALLLLPHVGRHILRTREHSTLLDIQFILVGLIGLVLCLLPMLSNHVWTIRYLPLWPLGMLLLIPTTMQAMFQKINGSGRFLTICLLPPLGLISFAPLPMIQFSAAEDAGLWSSLISLLPSLCLCASSLLIALTPTPKHEIKPKRVPATMTLETPGKNAAKSSGESPLRLEPKPVALAAATPPLVLDDASRMTPPADVDSALPLHNLERRMRGPLDVLLNEIGTLEQMNLPRDLVDHAHRLSRAGRQLSLLIGEISSGRHGSPVVIRQKSGMENAAQAHAAPFDLYDVILQAHNAVAETAEAKNLALSWFTAPHLARTYNGQGERLLRVLTLLAESAVHATDRGIVQIRVQRLPESNDPGMLQFTVSDTGKGAPPLQRSSISLVQVWELVGPTGGTLNVESGPTGTSIAFSMRFQALSAESAARSVRESAGPALRSEMCNALRILVISDVPGSRQLLCYYLDELPHEVREARSVDEALGMYMQAPGALLIFDGDLPEADVVRTIAAIRAFEGEHGYPLSSILALVKDDEQIERLRRAGCTHSLLKPVSRTELRQLALRLAPVPRSRNPHKTEPTGKGALSGSVKSSANAAAKPAGSADKKNVQKSRSAWSSPLSLERREEPEVRPVNAKPATLPPLVKSSASVSDPRPVAAAKSVPLPELRTTSRESAPMQATKSAPPLAQPVRLAEPVRLTSPARQASKQPAASTVPDQAVPVQAPAQEVPQERSAQPVYIPAAPTAPVTQTAPAAPIAPAAPVTQATPVALVAPVAPAQTASPAMQSATAQILDEMVRDAEEKIAGEKVTEPKTAVQASDARPADTPAVSAEPAPTAARNSLVWKPKQRQEAVRRAMDAVSVERKPIPWPGTNLRRADAELSSPYIPGNESEWVSDPRPIGSRERTGEDRSRTAAHAPAPTVADTTTPEKSLAPRTDTKPSGLVESVFSVFKKKPAHPTPQVFSTDTNIDADPEEWVSEPRPIIPREDKHTESAGESSIRRSAPAAQPSASQADDPHIENSEWVSEPHPKVRTLPNQTSPAQTQPEQAMRNASHDPLAPVEFAEPESAATMQEASAPLRTPPHTASSGRKNAFKPLLLPGQEPEAPRADNTAPRGGLELHFSTAPTQHEEIFNLTEIVIDPSELPELPLDPVLETHQPEPTTLYFEEDGTAKHGHLETPKVEDVPDIPAPLPEFVAESLAPSTPPLTDAAPKADGRHEPEIAALRHLPGKPLPDHPGLELVELPDETPVEEQLEKLETLSARAQEAFAVNDVQGLRETAAKLADTATALGMHGLIDLARCLEEVAGDTEATASLLETIDAAVRDEKL